MATISCPCCGDAMPSELVACWSCYRITNRLSPGTHLDPNGTTSTDQGYAVTITEAQITEWDQARTERNMAEVVAERDLMESDSFPRG